MGRLSNELVSELIGEIYDCVLDPEAWQGVLVRITEVMDAAYTTIALAGTTDNYGRFAAQSPWDQAQMRVLQEEYSFDDIPGLKAAVVGDINAPLTTLTCMSEAALHQTDFYRNWAAPQGLREGCMTKFVHTPDRIGLLGCTIRDDRGPIDADEQRFLALLSPHLRRASMIGDLLDQARVRADFFRGTLDALSAPILLTGADGHILHSNSSADAMLLADRPIRSRNGILELWNPVAARALLDAIAAAAEADISIGGRGIGLPISSAGEAPAVAYVLPLTRGTARSAFRPACAAIFVSTMISASPLPDAVLATLFDLTAAESRVMLKIGSGIGSAATAQQLGIGQQTLKTHLNRIFAKTGTRRQSDVVKLVADIGSPLVPADQTAHLSVATAPNATIQ